MTMLAYVKLVLEKVSFDKSLFEKELKKGLSFLLPEDYVPTGFTEICFILYRLVQMSLSSE